MTANALQVGANQYALELASNGTGTAAATTIDAGAFATSGLGALTTTTASQNAVISIGGTGGYQVVSASNQVTGLLPGVTVNLGQASSSPVTITVSPDGTQLATTVQALVTAANQVISTISTDTAYNASTNTAATLNGATSLTSLAQQVLAAVGTAVGTSEAGSDGTAGESAGLAITSQGTITFNQAAFEAAYAKNPAAVQAMFTEGGTFTAASPSLDGAASVAGATDDTSPGSYTVTVSQSAAQAVDTGSTTWSAPTSALSAAESYTVTSGSATATYAAAAGESVTDVISGLNSALATAGIEASAALDGFPWGVSGAAGLSLVRLGGHLFRVVLGRRPARSHQRGVDLQRSRRRRHHRRRGGDRLWTGPQPRVQRRPRGRSRHRRQRNRHHDPDDARHHRLRTRIRAGTGPPGQDVVVGPERSRPRDHRRPAGHAERGQQRDHHATAAGGHPTSGPHPGVHEPRGDVVQAASHELVPLRAVGHLVVVLLVQLELVEHVVVELGFEFGLTR